MEAWAFCRSRTWQPLPGPQPWHPFQTILTHTASGKLSLKKRGSIWKPDCSPEWKLLQEKLWAMCAHFLQDAVQKPYPGTSPHPISPKATRMPGCKLITLSRSSDTVGSEMSTNTLKAGPGAPGMGHWLYALPTAPFTKVANGPFKWGLQHKLGLAAPGAGHLCGKQLPGARQPCKAPLDHIGRHVAWCARRAREIRHNRLRDVLFEHTKTTGAIATSEQAMPLPRDSQPAAREARAVHTVDII